MFTSFVAGTSTSDERSTSQTTRPRRAQVHRACNWCRVNRIKCDEERPCRNCKNSKRSCSSNATSDFRSLAAAVSEIDRLRKRIEELESHSQKISASPTQASPPEKRHDDKSRAWRGVTVRTDPQYARSYGPTSLPFHVNRMILHMSTVLHSPLAQLVSYLDLSDASSGSAELANAKPIEVFSRHQQDMLFDMFWESHYPLLPIVDQNKVRVTYQSSRDDGSGIHSPSPLIDIIMALCTQYGMAVASSQDKDDAIADTRVFGREYYKRCLVQMSQQSELPSVEAMQIYTYATIYLVNAGLYGAAIGMLCQAQQVAALLGIETDRSWMAERDQALMQRCKWHLSAIDAKLQLHTGWPGQALSLFDSSSVRRPVRETVDISMNSYDSSLPGVTVYTYSDMLAELYLLSKGAVGSLRLRCSELIAEKNLNGLHDDDEVRETCGRLVIAQIPELEAWAERVPNGLRIKRKGGAKPMSLDRSPLELGFSEAPEWIQRQRLFLELEYHVQLMEMCRPFIRCTSTPGFYAQSANQLARRSTGHAYVITKVISQALSESNILRGWYRVSEWQENAAYTMVGFASTYPVCDPTPLARQGINTAIENFDLLKTAFPMAKISADRARLLQTKVGDIIEKLKAGVSGNNATSDTAIDTSSTVSSNSIVSPSTQQQSEDTMITSEDLFASFNANAGSSPTTALWDEAMMQDLNNWTSGFDSIKLPI